MADPEASGDIDLAQVRRTFELLWGVVGNDLPTDLSSAFFGELGRLGDPSTRSEATQTHATRLMLTHQGLLAAYYHRDRIESIETEVIQRIRAAPAEEILRPGSTASTAMPVLGHEFVAYLLAARRTLDYLTRGVASCFNVRDAYRIKKLASAVSSQPPSDLAQRVVQETESLAQRFPHLLTGDSRSDRDTAAHFWPIDPAWLLIVHFPDGGIGLELQDGGHNYLPTYNDLDLKRMRRDDHPLTAAVDRQLDELGAFCIRLVALAVDAELALRPV